jgi:hypothetical protein
MHTLQRRTVNSTPKAVAIYLTRLRPLLVAATSTRQGFVREIGLLLENARHQNPTTVAQAAGTLGRGQMALFREVRMQLDALHPPPSCQPCHHSVTSWIEQQIAACQGLLEVSVKGDPRRLREVQWLLADGREHARRFNGQYGRLVEMLRNAVGASTRAAAASGRAAPPERPSAHAARPVRNLRVAR